MCLINFKWALVSGRHTHTHTLTALPLLHHHRHSQGFRECVIVYCLSAVTFDLWPAASRWGAMLLMWSSVEVFAWESHRNVWNVKNSYLLFWFLVSRAVRPFCFFFYKNIYFSKCMLSKYQASSLVPVAVKNEWVTPVLQPIRAL